MDKKEFVAREMVEGKMGKMKETGKRKKEFGKEGNGEGENVKKKTAKWKKNGGKKRRDEWI